MGSLCHCLRILQLFPQKWSTIEVLQYLNAMHKTIVSPQLSILFYFFFLRKTIQVHLQDNKSLFRAPVDINTSKRQGENILIAWQTPVSIRA